MKRIFPFLFTFLLLYLTGCTAAAETGYTQIDQKTAKEMMAMDGTQIIVDVRTHEEYDSGHIPGAICIPNESVTTEKPEQLPFFCALSYDNYSNYFTGIVNVGIILTMNAPKTFYNLAYRKKAKEISQSFKGLNGEVEVYACCDTLQVTDYSRYNMASFKEEHKKEMREKQFPKDLEQAFQIGVRLGGK